MKSLKLNNLNTNRLKKEQMSSITGGGSVRVCGCGCCYTATGGSSSLNNGNANLQHGFHSPSCFNTVFIPPAD